MIISAITKYPIAANKKLNFISAHIDAVMGLIVKIGVGLLSITSKLIFSIISKIPVRKGVNVK